MTAQSDAYERLFALVMRALLVAHDNHPNSHEQIARDLLDQMIEALEAQE